MKEYTKQITVQAVQWTGENLEEVKAFCDIHTNGRRLDFYGADRSVRIGIFQKAKVGDYITNIPNYYAVEVVSPEDFTRDYKEVSE